MEVASQNKRFSNLALDCVFYFAFAFLVGIVSALVGLGQVIQDMNSNLLGLLILFFYYFPQELLWGRTLGKRITGTIVVNEDGTPLKPGRALLRTLCRFIPFDPLSFFGGQGKPVGWHDKLSKTRVIPFVK